MKKTIILLLLAFVAPLFAVAQSPAGRLPNTIVADVMAQMPAQNQEVYDRMMEDLISSGSEGLDILMSKIPEDPKVDDTAIGYAIGGLSYYVTTPGKESARQMVTKSLAKALDKTSHARIKEFLIRQLQIAGKNDAIDILKHYALVQDICQEAVSALVELDSPKSKEALESIIGQIPLKKVAAKAVGDAGLSSQEGLLLTWLGSGKDDLQKSVLYGLSRAGSSKSLKALKGAAEAVNYSYNDTDATDAYFTLLDRIADASAKEEKKLLKNPNPAVRSAGIALYVKAKGKSALPDVLKAMDDPSRVYRNSALSSVCCVADQKFKDDLVVKMQKVSPEAKIDIINWLGAHDAQSATAAIVPYLKSSDVELRAAAVTALTRLGNAEGADAMINVFTYGDTAEVNAMKDGLVWFKGDLSSKLLTALAGSSQAGQVAIIQILADKHAHQAAGKILEYTKASAPVADAAYKALGSVSTKDQLPELFTMLDASTGTQTADLQQAIGYVVSSMPADQALSTVKAKMGSKKALYYPVLGYIGTPAAFDILKKGIVSGDAAQRNAAVQTATTWNDFAASTALYDVFADKNLSSYHDAALQGYIRLLGKTSFNDVQKLIYLRNALDVAATTAQKNILLGEIAKLTTFNALILSSEYLSDPSTEQAAGTAVMNIALRDKNYQFWGQPVKDILKKFLAVRKGGDAPYDKAAIEKYLAEAPDCTGFVSIFNGKDLTGWKGLVENPISRSKMKPADLEKAQVKADQIMREGWEVRDGILYFTGHGDNLCTDKKYGDFEMYVDWKLFYENENSKRDGDAGIYLRGTPQVQIWDTCRTWDGADVGSGGLYNNEKNPRNPLVLADNAIGDWNTFYIKMVGERVTIYLNGVLVVDNVILENYWNRKFPLFPEEQIELQAHGSLVAYRDIFVKELPKAEPYALSAEETKEGFKILFDGESMNEWTGNTQDYVTENGTITLYPGNGGGGNLYTKNEYGDFVIRFDFMLTPGANNGLGIRTPMDGDAAYVGTELQILDNESPIYADLEEYQYHGSAYGIIPAKRGYLKPVGEWNTQEVYLKGDHLKITLNGTVILDGNLAEASKNGTIDGKDHPGLKNKKGHLAFLGHGSIVKFKDIRIKELK